jgi:hypothetical protein
VLKSKAMDLKKLTPEEGEQWILGQLQQLEASPEYIKHQEETDKAIAEGSIKLLESGEEPELTKENCSPELWKELGGDIIVDGRNLPF